MLGSFHYAGSSTSLSHARPCPPFPWSRRAAFWGSDFTYVSSIRFCFFSATVACAARPTPLLLARAGDLESAPDDWSGAYPMPCATIPHSCEVALTGAQLLFCVLVCVWVILCVLGVWLGCRCFYRGGYSSGLLVVDMICCC